MKQRHKHYVVCNLPEEVGEEEEELLLGEGLSDAEPATNHERDAALVLPVVASKEIKLQ